MLTIGVAPGMPLPVEPPDADIPPQGDAFASLLAAGLAPLPQPATGIDGADLRDSVPFQHGTRVPLTGRALPAAIDPGTAGSGSPAGDQSGPTAPGPPRGAGLLGPDARTDARLAAALSPEATVEAARPGPPQDRLSALQRISDLQAGTSTGEGRGDPSRPGAAWAGLQLHDGGHAGAPQAPRLALSLEPGSLPGHAARPADAGVAAVDRGQAGDAGTGPVQRPDQTIDTIARIAAGAAPAGVVQIRLPRSGTGAVERLGPARPGVLPAGAAGAFAPGVPDSGLPDGESVATERPVMPPGHGAKTNEQGAQPGAAIWRGAGQVFGQLEAPITMLRHGLQRIDVQLMPKELGRIEITVERREEGSVVLFRTSEGSVKELLEAQLPRLRTMMEAAGVTLVDAAVEDSTDAPAGGHSDRGQPVRDEFDTDDVDVHTGLEAAGSQRARGLIDAYV